jgi:hypothetical protein
LILLAVPILVSLIASMSMVECCRKIAMERVAGGMEREKLGPIRCRERYLELAVGNWPRKLMASLSLGRWFRAAGDCIESSKN